MSKSAAVRARAARVVSQIVTRGRTLDAALAAEETGTAQERGLLRALCYDSVRWYLRLEIILERLLTRGGSTLKPEVHALAIVGLCQLLHTDIPAHAAVDETVNATRVLGEPKAAGLINALLRRCQREGGKLGEEVDRDLARRTAHPQWLVDAFVADWQRAADDVLNANNQHPPFWLRVNRLRTSGVDYSTALEARGLRIAARAFADEALMLEEAVNPRELPGFEAGLISIQDAAAQLAARLLGSRPGERVLDACAAPGGKACHVLELQPQVSELVALDVSTSRLRRVEENLSRLQLRATLTEGDASKPDAWWDGKAFDRILLDVPCSATGVIRRHPDIKLLRRPEDISAFARRQADLLAALWPLLAPGGRVVYATCSTLTAENAAVVDAFLERHPDASDATASEVRALGLSPTAGCGYRIAPGSGGMDGFYYACLDKGKG
jgi:16S rRNA (cytosine967-C5)-methyltransferase